MRALASLFAIAFLISAPAAGQAFEFVWRAQAEEFQPDIDLSGRVNAIARHPARPNIIVVSTPTGGLWRSVDGGRRWAHVDTLPPPYLNDVVVHPDDPRLMIATADRDFGRYEVEAAPEPVRRTPAPVQRPDRLLRPALEPGSDARLPGSQPLRTQTASGGGIWISRDAGASWSRPASAVPQIARDFPDARICPDRHSAFDIATEPGTGRIFVGTDCGVAISENGGRTWRHEIVPGLSFGERVQTIAALGGGVVLIGTRRDGYFWSTDGGRTWANDPNAPGSARDLHGLSDSPRANEAFAVSIVDDERRFFQVTRDRSGLTRWRRIASLEPGDRPCGGIAYIQAFYGREARGGSTGDLYVFAGNRCHAFAGVAEVRLGGGLAFPAETDDWVLLDEHHSDARHIALRIAYASAVGSYNPQGGNVGGVLEPILDDGGRLADGLAPDFDSLVAFTANDGGLERWTSDINAEPVGSGRHGINALQIYEVSGQVIDQPARHDLYFATQDNDIHASDDGGRSWPWSVCCEGFGLVMERRTPTPEEALITFTGCGPCRTRQSPPLLADPTAWEDPFDDDASDDGYPLLLARGVYAEVGQADAPGGGVVPRLFRTIDDGETWRVISDIGTPVRDSFTVFAAGSERPELYGVVNRPRQRVPFYFGDRNIRTSSLVRVPNARRGVNIPAEFPAMNGFGSFGPVPTSFAWYRPYGLDSADSSHLIAPDIINRDMRQSFSNGENWTGMPALTDLVTREGELWFVNEVHEGPRYEPLVSKVSFFPDNPDFVLVGARQGGMYYSFDRGRNWAPVPGSEGMVNVTDIHWVSANEAIIATYGRGLWRVRMDGAWRRGERSIGIADFLHDDCLRLACRVSAIEGDELAEALAWEEARLAGLVEADSGWLFFDGGAQALRPDAISLGEVRLDAAASRLSWGRALSAGTVFSLPGEDDDGVIPLTREAGQKGVAVGVLLKEEQAVAIIFAAAPLDFPAPVPLPPGQGEVRHSTTPPMTGLPQIAIGAGARLLGAPVLDAGTGGRFLITARNLQPNAVYELRIRPAFDPAPYQVVADADGRFEQELPVRPLPEGVYEIVLAVPGEGEGQVVDLQDFIVRHVDRVEDGED